MTIPYIQEVWTMAHIVRGAVRYSDETRLTTKLWQEPNSVYPTGLLCLKTWRSSLTNWATARKALRFCFRRWRTIAIRLLLQQEVLFDGRIQSLGESGTAMTARSGKNWDFWLTWTWCFRSQAWRTTCPQSTSGFFEAMSWSTSRSLNHWLGCLTSESLRATIWRCFSSPGLQCWDLLWDP